MPLLSTRAVPALSMVLAALCTLLIGPDTVQARSRGDHERAHSAVQAGEVMPLEQVLARIAKQQPGQVLKIELEREDGLWTYEVKILRSDGQLVKLLLNARTAEVLCHRRSH